MPTAFTILQIAEAAGVGTATVDRVLNNRPGVNPATVERVQLAMEKLGAETPARGRPRATSPNYKFAFVLPATRRGLFENIDRVVAQSAGDFRHQHITEVTHRLPVDDIAVFAAELASMTDYDGVAVLAPDMPAVKMAINELMRAGVHVVTLFSDVSGSMRETFIGADNKAAGRTAGMLMGHALRAKPRPHCMLLSSPTRYTAEIDRSIGIQQLLEEKFEHVHCSQIKDMPEDEESAYAFAKEALTPSRFAEPIDAIHIVGSSPEVIVRALLVHCQPHPIVIAHDLIDQHRAMLITGELSYVLYQDIYYAVTTAAKVLRSLCDGMRGALTLGHPKIDIATVENLS